jgi:hypothetical protein
MKETMSLQHPFLYLETRAFLWFCCNSLFPMYMYFILFKKLPWNFLTNAHWAASIYQVMTAAGSEQNTILILYLSYGSFNLVRTQACEQLRRQKVPCTGFSLWGLGNSNPGTVILITKQVRTRQGRPPAYREWMTSVPSAQVCPTCQDSGPSN